MTTAPTLHFSEFAAWLRRNAGRVFLRNNTCECPVADWLSTRFEGVGVTRARWIAIGLPLMDFPAIFQRFIAAFDGGASALDALAEAEASRDGAEVRCG